MKEETVSFSNTDEYISQFPDEIQVKLQKIRETILQRVPEAKEKISYGMPAFEYHGNLVYFAAFKKHIGFYPTPSGIVAFEKELAPYKKAKGSAQFPLDQEIPFDLIEKIVDYRVTENLEKEAIKKNKTKK